MCHPDPVNCEQSCCHVLLPSICVHLQSVNSACVPVNVVCSPAHVDATEQPLKIHGLPENSATV